MPSAPNDRPTHETQDIRELFARSGKRPTRRFDEIVAAATNQQAQAADAQATTEDDDAKPERQAEADQAELPDRAAASAVAGAEADINDQTGRAEAQRVSGDGENPPHEEVPASAGHPPVRAPADSVSSRAVAAAPAAPPSAAPAPPADEDRDPAEPDVAQALQEQRFVLEPTPPGDESTVRWRSKGAMLLVAALLLVAFGLGAWLGRALAAPEPAATGRAPSATVPQACLDTSRLADQIIELLVAKRRTPEMGVLQAYVAASQQCREAASP